MPDGDHVNRKHSLTNPKVHDERGYRHGPDNAIASSVQAMNLVPVWENPEAIDRLYDPARD